MTSINKRTDDSKHAVYPNPSNHTLYVQSANSDEFKLLNVFGSPLLSFKTQTQNDIYQLDISALPPGIYILQSLNTGKKIWSEKIIKIE